MHVNLQRQLRTPFLATPGRDFALELWARPGFGSSSFTAVTWLAARLAPSPLVFPGLGTFYLDNAASVALPPVSLPITSGRAELSLRVPNQPALVGAPLFGQALLISNRSPATGLELAGFTADTVGR